MLNTVLLFTAGFLIVLLGTVSIKKGFLKQRKSFSDGKFGVALLFFSFFIFSHGVNNDFSMSLFGGRLAILLAVLLWSIAVIVGRSVVLSKCRQKIFSMMVVGFLIVWLTFESVIENWTDWFLLFSFSVWVVIESVLFILQRRDKPLDPSLK